MSVHNMLSHQGWTNCSHQWLTECNQAIYIDKYVATWLTNHLDLKPQKIKHKILESTAAMKAKEYAAHMAFHSLLFFTTVSKSKAVKALYGLCQGLSV